MRVQPEADKESAEIRKERDLAFKELHGLKKYYAEELSRVQQLHANDLVCADMRCSLRTSTSRGLSNSTFLKRAYPIWPNICCRRQPRLVQSVPTQC